MQDNRRYALWYWESLETQKELMGDPAPYSVEKMRHTLETFIQYCAKQGLIGALLPQQELFEPHWTFDHIGRDGRDPLILAPASGGELERGPSTMLPFTVRLFLMRRVIPPFLMPCAVLQGIAERRITLAIHQGKSYPRNDETENQCKRP